MNQGSDDTAAKVLTVLVILIALLLVGLGMSGYSILGGIP